MSPQENEIANEIMANIDLVRENIITPEALYFQFGGIHEEEGEKFVVGFEYIGFPTMKERH